MGRMQESLTPPFSRTQPSGLQAKVIQQRHIALAQQCHIGPPTRLRSVLPAPCCIGRPVPPKSDHTRPGWRAEHIELRSVAVPSPAPLQAPLPAVQDLWPSPGMPWMGSAAPYAYLRQDAILHLPSLLQLVSLSKQQERAERDRRESQRRYATCSSLESNLKQVSQPEPATKTLGSE